MNHSGTLVLGRRTPGPQGRGWGVSPASHSTVSQPSSQIPYLPLRKGVQVSPRKLSLHSAAASPRPCSPGTSAALDSLAGE